MLRKALLSAQRSPSSMPKMLGGAGNCEKEGEDQQKGLHSATGHCLKKCRMSPFFLP